MSEVAAAAAARDVSRGEKSDSCGANKNTNAFAGAAIGVGLLLRREATALKTQPNCRLKSRRT